jgi:hypothetical protein
VDGKKGVRLKMHLKKGAKWRDKKNRGNIGRKARRNIDGNKFKPKKGAKNKGIGWSVICVY